MGKLGNKVGCEADEGMGVGSWIGGEVQLQLGLESGVVVDGLVDLFFYTIKTPGTSTKEWTASSASWTGLSSFTWMMTTTVAAMTAKAMMIQTGMTTS